MRRAGPVVLAATLYVVLAVAITWPLTPKISTSIAGDLGDPLFVTWVMHWVLRHVGPALAGRPGALTGLWDAPIFHPEPNTLAFSEHFTAQALQVVPVWWATGNPILAYNVAFLTSFVLTGLATFALTRALAGGFLAPFAAGVFAAFNPYRLTLEVHHLHVLSIQWLPLAMLGLHHYVTRASRMWLAIAAMSVVALNTSAGYFMLFGAPFLAAFTLIDLRLHGLLRDRMRWRDLTLTAILVAACTAPFVLPYLEMQRQLDFHRTLDEVKAYSARIEHYQAAWPWLAGPVLLTVLGLVARHRGTHGTLAPGLWALVFLCFTLSAVWLSFGPVIQPLDMRAPYRLLYEHVPGFQGLRVVSRYVALALVFLAVGAGIGASLIVRLRIVGPVLVGVLISAHLWFTWPHAFPLNAPVHSPGLALPPAYLEPAPRLPQIYMDVSALPREVVLAEFPFGDPWYELRYMYFANFHGKPIANGYSGVFPASYTSRQRALAGPLADMTAAAEALAGVTHVIVHERAWPDDTGVRIRHALEGAGARPVARADGAWLYALR